MMDSTAAAQAPTGVALMGTITTVQLVLIALLAIVTIGAMFWGMKLKRRRRDAERAFVENREAAEEGTPGSTLAAPAPPPEGDVGDVPVAAPMQEPVETAPLTAPAALPAQQAQHAQPSSDLTQLKGLGPKLAGTLAELGITRIEQIAALSPGEAHALDSRLGAFAGRMARDRWIEQARLLSAGDRGGYEAEFGKLGDR
jgi:predicted flap endonuclease-1-like 5' DNA nuclease